MQIININIYYSTKISENKILAEPSESNNFTFENARKYYNLSYR